MAYNGIEQQAIALLFVLKLNWLATPTYDLSAVCSLHGSKEVERGTGIPVSGRQEDHC